jgi:hypothetical protein
VRHEEVADHRVERRVLERQRVGVGLAELDLGMERRGEVDHLAR